MARLPAPGSDDGQWGDILNEYLLTSLSSEGELKPGTVSSDQIQIGSITANKLAGDIPKSALSLSVQASLSAADSSTAVPDATDIIKGKLQLAGDLAGTSSSASAPIITNNAITTNKINAGAVTTSKLADGSVTGGSGIGVKLAQNTVTDENIANAAAINRTKLDSSSQLSLGLADTSLQINNNLGDLASTTTARTNLGLGTAATKNEADFDAAGSANSAQSAAATDATAKANAVVASSLQKSSNLSDLASKPAARTNLGLGSAALKNEADFEPVGTVTTALSTAAADATSKANAAQGASLQKTSNLSDITNSATARTNLGLGTAATKNEADFDAAGSASASQTAAATDATTKANAAIASSLQKGNNLSDLTNTATARSNLGIVNSINRLINNVSTNTAAGSTALTDYVYSITGTTTLNLPTAVGNTNAYTLKNSGTGIVTISTTGSQTIDGSTSITISPSYAYILYSNNANWFVT